MLLGGRAAGELIFGHLSTGAADGVAKVTGIARSMVMRYSMVKALGHVAYEEERSPFLAGAPVMPGPREYSEDTARQIDVAVREFVGAAYDKALAILTRERALLERGAKQLLEKETLAEAELVEYREAIAGSAKAA